MMFTILRNRTYVPVYYHGNKIWVRMRVRIYDLITRTQTSNYIIKR